jgi:hypothetical protein
MCPTLVPDIFATVKIDSPIWDSDSYLETGIDEEPDVCYRCGWQYDKTKDTLRNVGCFTLIFFLGFLYITFLFSW